MNVEKVLPLNNLLKRKLRLCFGVKWQYKVSKLFQLLDQLAIFTTNNCRYMHEERTSEVTSHSSRTCCSIFILTFKLVGNCSPTTKLSVYIYVAKSSFSFFLIIIIFQNLLRKYQKFLIKQTLQCGQVAEHLVP